MKTTEMTTPLETTKTPLEAFEKEKQGGSSQEVFDALRKAFNMIGRLLLGYVMFVGIYWNTTDKRTNLEKWRSVCKSVR